MTQDLSQPLGKSRRAIGAALIAIVTLVAYWPAIFGELVYDDLYIIGQNPTIRSFANLPTIFTSSYWDFLDAETESRVGYYRPLTAVLLTVGYAIRNGEPFVFHLISILLHVTASLAAWLFAARLARSERIGFWAALLFALHPIHVESVAWISALNDPLFATFGFLSLASYVGWRARGSTGVPWAAGAWLLPALLSKEAAVAIVLIALATDIARGGMKPLVRAYLPYLVAGLVWYVARAITFGDPMAGFDRTTTDFNVSPGRLALLRLELLGGAVGLLAVPWDLNLFRPFRPTIPSGDTTLILAGVWSLVLLVSLLLLWRKRALSWLGLALIVPAGLFPIVLRVTSVGTFPLSDRFLYVPAFGVAILAATFVLRRLPRPAAQVVLVLLCVAYGARTWAHTFVWQNEEALFRAAAVQNPTNPNVHWGLGRVILERYREEAVWEHLNESRECFNRSMRLLELASGAYDEKDLSIFATKDDHLQTNLGLGWTYVYEAQFDPFHDYETARVIFARVVQSYPTSERGYVGLGVTLMLEGQLELAAPQFRKAIELNPRSPEAHHNMARLLHRLEDRPGAEKHFREAMKYRADDLNDLVGLARTLELGGDPVAAFETALRAHELDAEASDPLVILGSICSTERRYPEALQWLNRAVEADPQNGSANLRRGVVLMAMGQRQSALTALMKACELMPRNFDAHYNVGVMLLEQTTNAQQAAMPYLLKAYATRPDDLRARELQKRLQQLDIIDADYYWELARADADLGMAKEALDWVERALAIDPDHGPSHFLIGVILKQPEEITQEEADLALEHLQRAAGILSDSFHAQLEYGEMLARVGQHAEALPVLMRALTLLSSEEMPESQRKEIGDNLREAIQAIQAGGPDGTSEGGR